MEEAAVSWRYRETEPVAKIQLVSSITFTKWKEKKEGLESEPQRIVESPIPKLDSLFFVS